MKYVPFRAQILSLALFLLSSVSAHADLDRSTLAGLQAALNSRDQAIADITGNNSRAAAQWALDTVVIEGIRALRSNGDQGLADRYENEWNGIFSNFLLENGILGDHKPLLVWLANFYTKLEDRLGAAFIKQGLLGDIYLMNYAIPIVFAPKGDWRTPTTPNRDWVEYRKHFIPFANVITYWGVKIACNRIMKNQGAGKQGKKLCEKAATKLRWAMGRHIAPKISDFIFNKSNGERAVLDITSQDLVFINAETLYQEILKEGAL